MTLSLADYALFIETIPDAAVVVDASGSIVLANSQVGAVFGHPPGELRGQPLDLLLPEQERSGHAAHLTGYFAAPYRRPMGQLGGLSGRRKDGSLVALDIMLNTISLGDTLYAVGILRDVTRRRDLEVALTRALDRETDAARTDHLTGAANTRRFHELVQYEIDRFERYRHPFTLAYLDIDGFKAINDLLGHDVGDEVLCKVADTARSQLRKSDSVARLGGDEFALMLPETDRDEARHSLAKLRGGLLAAVNANNWPVTFSIGALTCRTPPQSARQLIKRADELMYEIKTAGKDDIRHGIFED